MTHNSPDFSKALSEVFDDWLVHDEDCPTSWSGVGPEKCACIAKDQKRNLSEALLAAFRAYVKKNGISEFPDCEVYGNTASWCNNCWPCKRRDDHEFVTGYETGAKEATNQLLQGLDTQS